MTACLHDHTGYGPERWGAADRIGAGNLLTAERRLAALSLVQSGALFDLGHVIEQGAPRIPPNQTPFVMTLSARADNVIRRRRAAGAHNDAGTSLERIEMTTHVGTHIDALGHATSGELLYNGLRASEVLDDFGLTELGVENVPPMITRGVNLDLSGIDGAKFLEAGRAIGIDDLERARDRAGVDIGEGDVVCLHTGWGHWFMLDNTRYVAGEPGIDEHAARWLTERGVVAIAADNMAVEVVPHPSHPALILPVHQHALAQAGVYLIENLKLDELTASGASEFCFILLATKFKGATGSPVRPVAMVCIRSLVVLASACLLALAPGDARSQSGGQQDSPAAALHIRAVLGFSDTFSPGRWTPLTVTLSNRGTPVSGHLEVSSMDGDEFRRTLYPVVHTRPLELGRDAQKRFHFTLYLQSLAHPVRVRVRDGSRVLASKDLDLRPRYSASRLLLVVSRDADLDYLNADGDTGLRVLYPHPDALPRRWQGYDSVAALVLHGLSLESLEADQFDALRRWIARGGMLAVSGGPDYGLLTTPRLASLLPATPVGMRALDDAAEVGRALGAPLVSERPIHVNRVARIRGQVLHDVDGVPLVLTSRHGNGQVLYLTYDVAREPFDRWSPMGDVWTRLLDRRSERSDPVHQPDEISTVPALVRQQVQGFPGHGTLLVFLALYLSVLATSYRLRSARRAPPATLSLSAIGIPLLFAPAAYALFSTLLFQSGPTATLMTVIEPLGDGQAALRVDLGLHSNHDGPLRFSYDGATPVFRAPLQARDRVGGEGWRFAPRRMEPGDRHAYRLHLLEGHDIVPFDLQATVSAASELHVRNDSGRPLREAWVVYRGAAWFIGDVETDARFDLRRPPDMVASDHDEWWQGLSRDPRVDQRRFSVVSEVLSRKVDGEMERSYPGVGEALLLGYTTSPLRPAGPSAGWRRTELNLVLLRFPALLPWPETEDASNEST